MSLDKLLLYCTIQLTYFTSNTALDRDEDDRQGTGDTADTGVDISVVTVTGPDTRNGVDIDTAVVDDEDAAHAGADGDGHCINKHTYAHTYGHVSLSSYC